MYLNLNPEDLKKSAVSYRKELLIAPLLSAKRTLEHFTGRPGVAGREVIGQLGGNVELAPYKATRIDEDGFNIVTRELETFLGSVVKRFDFNEAAKTVYGSAVSQGEALTQQALVQLILIYMSAKLGKSLDGAIWKAMYKADGSTTADLFNGFDTITEKEIEASTISTDAGNLYEFDAAIDSNNAFDLLTAFYQSASDELQLQETKLFVPVAVYNAYTRDYMNTVGATSYNTQYNRVTLEGSNNLCELVPLAGKKDSKFLHLTTKANMLYGYGDGMADEKVAVEKHHEFLLSFIATMYFGVQFESIAPETLFVGKMTV